MCKQKRNQSRMKPLFQAALGLGLGSGLLGTSALANDQCPPLIQVKPLCPPPAQPQCPPSSLQPLPQPPAQATPPRREGEATPPPPTPTPGAAPLPDSAQAFGQAPMQGTAAAESFAPNMLGDFFGGGTRRTTRATVPMLVQRRETVHVSIDEGGLFFIRNQPGPNPNQPPGTYFVPDPNAHLSLPLTIVPLAARQPNAFSPPNPSYVIINGQATNIRILSTDLGTLSGTADLSYAEQLALLEMQIASPGAGGNVGRGKIAENNSPVPGDRAYLRYSYFDNVALAPGQNVHRYTLGMEKTFLEGEASVEVRLPFAGTVDPSYAEDEGLINRSTEFGNLNVILKALAYNSDTFRVSWGLGVGIPTANDVHVTSGGVDLLRIQNRVVHLMPFVAGLYMPDDQFFLQGFLQLDVGAGGHPVDVSPDLTQLQRVGYLNDATLMTFDVSAGYWLYRDSRAGLLSGLAPFVELHYNAALERADEVSYGPFRIGDLNSRFDIVNLTIGTHFEFGCSSILTIGLGMPLTGLNNREFDYEVGILFNHRFGPVSWPN